MFSYLIGLKQPRFVTGYSAPELDIAIEQGEIDGRSTVADSLLHEKPQWVDKGLMNFHGIIEIPKGRKHSHRRPNCLHIETFSGQTWTGDCCDVPTFGGNLLVYLPRLKTVQISQRCAKPIETPSFSRSIQSSMA
jgi:hypothetical protein